MIAVNSLRQPWKKRLQERAEKKAMKHLENELKEMAEKKKEVLPLYVCKHGCLHYIRSDTVIYNQK